MIGGWHLPMRPGGLPARGEIGAPAQRLEVKPFHLASQRAAGCARAGMNTPTTRRDWLRIAGLTCGVGAWGAARLCAAEKRDDLASRAEDAHRLIERRVAAGEVAAAAFLARQGSVEFVRAYGHARVDTPFLIASPTKPMTASAVLWLLDQRQIALTDPVQKYLPQFSGGGRERVTIHHLLTHTSGLPDMLPENVELRKRHAPLSEFVERTCRTPLLFAAGEKVSYQSMGILLATAIAEKVSGQPMPALLEGKVFRPLKMTRTALGLGRLRMENTAQCQVPEQNDWDWNSRYWRNLGAPWGGAHSTARDLALFLEAFGSATAGPWSRSTREEMCRVQTGALRPSYGLGWVREPGAFGRTCSADTFGHFGSTGTVAWHDPRSRITCVILTTLPATESKSTVLVPVSEKVGGG
jgi:CubicO group peptidase (beta-lactamase class C family)